MLSIIIITQIAKTAQSVSITQIPLLSCSIPFQNNITLISLLSSINTHTHRQLRLQLCIIPLGITALAVMRQITLKKSVCDTDDSSKIAITFKITVQK
jgi:hypothetical protein